MSDRSETSSVNGEWERMSERSSASVGDYYLSLKQKIAKLEEENQKISNENRKMKEESREQIKEKEEEIHLLRSQFKQNKAVFTLNKWMKDEIEEMKLTNGKLNEKAMELYKAIWEKREAKLQSTTSSERRQLNGEIQKLEDLCEKISKDVKKVNEECIQEITANLQNGTANVKEPLKTVQNSSTDRFLGKYVSTTTETNYKEMEFKKADEDGYYEICFTLHSGKTSTGSRWVPDNVKRDGFSAWVDGDVLYLGFYNIVKAYELCERGLIRDGHLYVRA